VIGDSLYELKFRVEMNAEVGAPHLMEMDPDHEGDGSGNRKEDEVSGRDKQLFLGPKLGSGEATNSSSMKSQGVGHGSTKSLPIFLI
jgi:hypothetical protein